MPQDNLNIIYLYKFVTTTQGTQYPGGKTNSKSKLSERQIFSFQEGVVNYCRGEETEIEPLLGIPIE